MTSTRPYLLRAMYEWILDNTMTPCILVNVDDTVEVPREYVRDGKIVLNISPTAVRNLTIDNEWVNFSARFSGRSQSVLIPASAVLAIYTKENGKGMSFEPENTADETPPPTPEPPTPVNRSKPVLKLVK